jgi:hypothetical protein
MAAQPFGDDVIPPAILKLLLFDIKSDDGILTTPWQLAT